MSQPAPSVSEILSRVDHLTRTRTDLSPTKLSKMLFGSGHALDKIRAGERDIRTSTLERVRTELTKMERESTSASRRTKRARQ